MKKGDKVYCKKTFRTCPTCEAFFMEGEYYEIFCINGKFIEMLYDNNKRSYDLDDGQFVKYFLSTAELRKLKLQKINEKR